MDQLHLIKVFVAVVDAQGFAGAARKLGISPPAVTRAISELESQLGVRLLTRTTRVVRVTEPGARYAEDCRRVLADLEQANESVTGLHGAPRGRLTITAPVLFGGRYVTPIVTGYLQRYPQVSVACMFLDRVVNMMDEGVDVAIRIGELPDSSLQAVRVGQVRVVVCASPQYLAQHGTPQVPADLLAHQSIVAGGSLQAPEWRFERAGQTHVVKVQPRLLTTSNDSARAAALDGFGLTRLLSYQVADEVAGAQLRIVLQEFEPVPRPIHVVHREGRNPSRKARAFIDMAIERLKAEAFLN